MSFLILSFRKLSLKRKINNGNFRLMQLQMTQDKIQSQIADAQKLNAQIQDNWTSLTSSLSTMSGSIFNAQMKNAQSQFTNAEANYNKANEAGNTAEAEKYAKMMEEAKNASFMQQRNIFELQNNQATAIMAMKQSVGNVFEAAQKAKLEELQKQDQSLSLEKESLSDQLKSWEAEYSSLDKAVSEAAKSSAPQYC